MLDKTGDLIPVRSEAVNIPWTKRKSQVLNFIHRGMVKFETHVYDTNVGDISPLSSYFNPQRWTVKDLNEKFGIQTQNPDLSVGVDTSPGSGAGSDNPSTIVDINDKEESQLEDKTGSTIRCLLPRLLIYPEKEIPPPTEFVVSCSSMGNTDLSRTSSPATSDVKLFIQDSNSNSCISSTGPGSLLRPKSTRSFSKDDSNCASSFPRTKFIEVVLDETTNDSFNIKEHSPSTPLPHHSLQCARGGAFRKLPTTMMTRTNAIAPKPYISQPPPTISPMMRLAPNSDHLTTRRRKMTADDTAAGDNFESYFQPKRQKGSDTVGRNRFNSLSSAILDIATGERSENKSVKWSPGSFKDLHPVKNTLCFGGQVIKAREEHARLGHAIVRRDAIDFLLNSASKSAVTADVDNDGVSFGLSTSSRDQEQGFIFNETLV